MNLSDYGTLYENYSLKNANTYKIDSKCKYFLIINNIKSLTSFIKEYQNKYFVIGNGSNIILKNEYYDYPFIKLDFNEIEKLDNNKVMVGSSVMPGRLINFLYDYQLGGLEWASGIPGTIGGIIYNNAGAYNEEISNFIESVTVLNKNTGNIEVINQNDCNFSYRNSVFKEKNQFIIVSAILKLNAIDINNSKELIADRLNRRRASQPLEFPSAGSVFRNPKDDFAGRLVEINDFKNYHINDAYVSDKHANFIINKGSAKGIDIVNLINEIKTKVKDNNGIDLILEQEIID